MSNLLFLGVFQMIFTLKVLNVIEAGFHRSQLNLINLFLSIITLRVHHGDSHMSSLRESLRTHKVFTKDQCLNLNYRKFSIKSYVLDVY